MGVAVGDYDNDGFPDLFITCVGQSRLFHNTGKGTFVDVTTKSGLGGHEGFSTSALWFDYDRDGLLDLFVCNYVKWSREPTMCSAALDGKHEVVLHAGGLSRVDVLAVPQPRRRHVRGRDGDERNFRHHLEVARRHDARLRQRRLARSLRRQRHAAEQAVSQPCATGRFEDVGVQAGLAFSEDGKARAGMGVDAADFDNSGIPGLVVTNFDNEMLGLYRRRPRRSLRRSGARIGRRTRISRRSLGFGCFFFDADLDGLLDLLVVNGHIDDSVRNLQPRHSRTTQPPHLFWNRGKAAIPRRRPRAGRRIRQPKVGRGAAFGDFDNDGDLDVLITTNHGPAYLVPQRQSGGQPVYPLPADRARSRTATPSAHWCASSRAARRSRER